MNKESLLKALQEFRLTTPYYKADAINFILSLANQPPRARLQTRFSHLQTVSNNDFFGDDWDWATWDVDKAYAIHAAIVSLDTSCMVKENTNYRFSDRAATVIAQQLAKGHTTHNCPALVGFKTLP